MAAPLGKLSRRSYIKSAGIVGGIGLSGCTASDDGGTSSGDDQYEISVTQPLPESHWIVQASVVPFVEQVEEETDGQVQFEVHHGTVSDPPETIDVITAGTVDMGLGSPPHFSDQMPLGTVTQIPGTYDSVERGSEELYNLYMEQIDDAECKPLNLEPIIITTVPHSLIHTVNDPLMETNDFEGLTVRTGGGLMSTVVNILGGAAAEMPSEEAYTAMDRGTIDATIVDPLAVEAYDLNELVNYTALNMTFGSFLIGVWMDLDKYNEMPPDLQDTVTQIGNDISIHHGQVADQELNDVFGRLEEDIELYNIPENTLNTWSGQLDPVADQWADDIGTEEAQEVKESWVNRW